MKWDEKRKAQNAALPPRIAPFFLSGGFKLKPRLPILYNGSFLIF
jgi:hypothetical protein